VQQVTPREVTEAIVRWLLAMERAGKMRTVSGQLVQAALYGCPIRGGGRPPDPHAVGLREAERPLKTLTRAERRLLVEKYWNNPQQVDVTRETPGGKAITYRKAVWQPDKLVAVRLGLSSERAAKRRLSKARAKVRVALKGQ